MLSSVLYLLMYHAIHAKVELNTCEEKAIGKYKILDVHAHGGSYINNIRNIKDKNKRALILVHIVVRNTLDIAILTFDKYFNWYNTEYKIYDCPLKIWDQVAVITRRRVISGNIITLGGIRKMEDDIINSIIRDNNS